MLNLRYYWLIFMRRFPYFLIVALVISVASIIAAITLPPSYVSEMRLIVEAPQIPTQLATPTALTPAQEQLQIVQERLLTRANLLDIANRLQVLENQNEMNPDQIEQAMRARTSVWSSAGRGQAPLMTIRFEAPTARNAASVLNEYLTLIQQEDIESRTGRATQTLEFFEQEVARLSEKLAEQAARILAFKTENADALPESLIYRLNQQTILQDRLAVAERNIASLRDQKQRLIDVFRATGQVAGVTGQVLTAEQLQLESLRAQLNNALAIYSPENPQIKMLQAQIAQVEEVVSAQPTPQNSGGGTGNSLLDAQLAQLDAQTSVLEDQKTVTIAQLQELNNTIARAPAVAIQLEELTLNYQNTQQQYNTATNRLSQASTGERIEVMARGQRISIIDPPSTPNAPAKPNRILIAGGGSIFGIMAGLGLVVLLEFLNKSIRRPEDLVSKLGITPLATVPYTRTRGEMIRQRGLKTLWIMMILIGIPAAVYAVHTYYQPLDLIADQIMDKIGVRW